MGRADGAPLLMGRTNAAPSVAGSPINQRCSYESGHQNRTSEGRGGPLPDRDRAPLPARTVSRRPHSRGLLAALNV